jgi:hypothetical protein
VKRLPKVLWVILAVFAFANGLEALRYLLPHVPFPAELDNFIHRRVALSPHAMGGAIADGGSAAVSPTLPREPPESSSAVGMDLLRRRVAWLVRFGVDRAAFADRMDGCLGISNAGRGLDCNDRAGGAIHLAMQCSTAGG